MDAAMPQWVQDGGCDVIVAQRTCMPGPTQLWQRLAREGKAKLVLELDDDLWNVEPHNKGAHQLYAQGIVRNQWGEIVQSDAPIGQNLRDNIAVADVVTVSTEPLAEIVSQWNRNVVILPNCVPSWLLDVPAPNQYPDRITLGWGGSPSHTRDFGEIAKPLRRVLQRFGDAIEFHCVGPDYTARVASRRGRTRHTGWFDGVEDYLRGIDFSIGLAPLRPSVFNVSKSDLKLLEMAALGIPAIVSNTGPYRRAFESGAPCIPVNDGKEFEVALVELIQSPEQRSTLGKQAREWAAERVIDKHVHEWEAAYAA
jgi:glycosyltransferase involved in cell wall biosynthesis